LTSKRTVEPQTADGVVAMVHHPRSLDPFRRAGVPVVNTARTLDDDDLIGLEIPSVLPDDAAVGELALQYFGDRGFRAFGFCGHPRAAWSRQRRDAFVSACRAQGSSCSVTSAADEVSSEWLRSLPRSCGVLAANDRYAWHAIDACRELGIRVPEDLAILGVDNDALLTEMVRPTLSSVILPSERIGYEAARLLDQMLRGKRIAPKLMKLPPEGVATRHSTDVLSIEDADVAEATRFIRENAAVPIAVQDILNRVSMSRRNLERRFKRALGRSLLDEIRRVHLDRAAKLLRETDLDMPEVARQSGFASAIRFSTVFKEMMGTAPSLYRRQRRRGVA
jgi:LacI family transcriptional regulator